MKNGILILIIILLASACTGQRVDSGAYNLMLRTLLSHSVDEISVDSLAGIQDEVTLLDARSREEFEISHIQGAKFVRYEDFDSTRVAGLDKNQPVVVYCSVGYRSEKITEKLRDLNFTHTANLYGGIFEWKNRGYEIVDAEGTTDRVHAYSKMWSIWLKEGEKVYE